VNYPRLVTREISLSGINHLNKTRKYNLKIITPSVLFENYTYSVKTLKFRHGTSVLYNIISYSENVSKKQDFILRDLLNLININESGGINFEGSSISEWIKYRQLILNLKSESLEDDNIQKKLKDMLYYFESENEPCFLEIGDILISLKKQQSICYDAFIELLYKKLDVMKQELQVEKYILYYPININILKSDITEFHIGDFSIKLLNYSDAKNDIDNINLDEQFFKAKNIDKNRYQYVKVSVCCRNKEYAKQEATRYVGLTLFFISFVKMFRREQIWLDVFPEPLIELNLDHIFVFENNEFSKYYNLEDTNDVNKFYDLNDVDIIYLNTMISQFNEADKKIQDIIHDSMKQYHIGLKEKTASRSFLSFWTSLEILTLKDKKLSHFKVKERLKSAIKMSDIHEYQKDIDEYQIERLYRLRNKLVHDGIHSDISQFDRNVMKNYVEILFQYFMFNFSKHSPSEINMIYEFLGKDIDSLVKSN
jgi:hypothetical protein